MNYKFMKFLLCCLALSLSACGYIQKQQIVGNQSNKYLQARLSSPLNIPPELADNISIQDTYPIPSKQQVHGPVALEPVPPNLS